MAVDLVEERQGGKTARCRLNTWQVDNGAVGGHGVLSVKRRDEERVWK